MLLVDREGLPLADDIASANRNEVTLIEPLLGAARAQSGSRASALRQGR